MGSGEGEERLVVVFTAVGSGVTLTFYWRGSPPGVSVILSVFMPAMNSE